ILIRSILFFFFQAEDGIRDFHVTGVQTCALPISSRSMPQSPRALGNALLEAASEKNLDQFFAIIHHALTAYAHDRQAFEEFLYRSEERRVGKECRSRWRRNHDRKKVARVVDDVVV